MESSTYYKLTVPQRINLYNCDQGLNMTLRAYLEWSGELGNRHLEYHGVSWQLMQQQRQVFLLSRLAFQRLAPATYGMECRFSTWEACIKGAQFIRNFSLEDAEGHILAQSTSTWILVDPVARRILRPSRCFYTFHPQPDPVTPVLEPLRLSELPELGRHTVLPSQIDCNGHLGNQYYADLLSDFAPAPFPGRTVQALQISFDHEAYLGQELTLSGQGLDDSSYLMQAVLPDGRRCFGAKVTVARDGTN